MDVILDNNSKNFIKNKLIDDYVFTRSKKYFDEARDNFALDETFDVFLRDSFLKNQHKNISQFHIFHIHKVKVSPFHAIKKNRVECEIIL